MENLLDIAKYIYDNINFPSDKKVQKIVYYAYSWYIAMHNDDKDNIKYRLINEHPEAWIHGPVFRELFDIMTYKRKEFMDRVINIEEDTKNFLDKIIKLYGRYTGNQLEDMTHNETPWREARENLLPNERGANLIKDKVIFEYYKN